MTNYTPGAYFGVDVGGDGGVCRRAAVGAGGECRSCFRSAGDVLARLSMRADCLVPYLSSRNRASRAYAPSFVGCVMTTTSHDLQRTTPTCPTCPLLAARVRSRAATHPSPAIVFVWLSFASFTQHAASSSRRQRYFNARNTRPRARAPPPRAHEEVRRSVHRRHQVRPTPPCWQDRGRPER